MTGIFILSSNEKKYSSLPDYHIQVGNDLPSPREEYGSTDGLHQSTITPKGYLGWKIVIVVTLILTTACTVILVGQLTGIIPTKLTLFADTSSTSNSDDYGNGIAQLYQTTEDYSVTEEMNADISNVVMIALDPFEDDDDDIETTTPSYQSDISTATITSYSTDTSTTTTIRRRPIQPDHVWPGDMFFHSTKVYSREEKCYMTLSRDGNLKVFGKSYPHDVISYVQKWSTNIEEMEFNGIPSYAKLEMDGNFVLYNEQGTAYWSTNTTGHPDAYIKIQDDCKICIYITNGCIWSSPHVDV